MGAQIGGSTATEELSRLSDMTDGAEPIRVEEFRARIAHLQDLMRSAGQDVAYVHAGTNLHYFTGIDWTPSERLVGALIPCEGDIAYIAPEFERGTLEGFLQIEGAIHCWEEHESPFDLVAGHLPDRAQSNTAFALDETTPFFISEGLRQATVGQAGSGNEARGRLIVSAGSVFAACRMRKSASEIALIQRAMKMTMAVQEAAARILRPGITAAEVTDFIHSAHKAVGSASGSYFCIVLFGPDTAFPHGVKSPKALEENELVLVDTGCKLHNYISDITRTYIFGTASAHQEKVWHDERKALDVAFAAAQTGSTCGAVDDAVRAFIETENYGPDYKLPGVGHRTGHGIGLDIHEAPYLVKNDQTVLDAGMCFSIEPMLCIPGEFGVRLEDHVYMDETGANWFTQPSRAIDDPF